MAYRNIVSILLSTHCKQSIDFKYLFDPEISTVSNQFREDQILFVTFNTFSTVRCISFGIWWLNERFKNTDYPHESILSAIIQRYCQHYTDSFSTYQQYNMTVKKATDLKNESILLRWMLLNRRNKQIIYERR